MPYRPSSPIRSGLPAPYLMEEQLGETLAREHEDQVHAAQEAAAEQAAGRKLRSAEAHESLRERLEHALRR